MSSTSNWRFPEQLSDGWIGLPIKRWVSTKVTDGPHETPELIPEGIPFVSAESMQDGRINFDARRGFISKELHEEYCRKLRPRRDDIFICKSGATTGKLAIIDTDVEFSVWSPLALLRVDPKRILPRFLFLALHATYVQDQVRTTWSLGTQPNISMGAIERLFVVAPTPKQQASILAVIDKKLEKIDALIAKKEQLIELLQEKRTALISHAVTKGLNPRVLMKDSELEWVSQIPENWGVQRNGFLFYDRDERGYPDLPILEVSIHTGVKVRQFSGEHVEQQAEDPATYKRTLLGDLAFNKMRMWQGAVGVSPVDGLVSPDYQVCRPREGVHARYFEELFRTSFYMTEINRYSHGIVKDRNRLYWDRFKEMPSLLPPPEEQRRIVEHIDDFTARIGGLIAKVREGIEKLREYRTALISAAVTGKIDVREEALT